MTVTEPKGFLSAGVAAGIREGEGLDLAVVINQGPLNVGAAVYTSNRAKANPILWSRSVLSNGLIKAVVLNSGGANCFTGDFGFETSRLTAELAAELLASPPEQVQVCSTGMIGVGGEEFREKILTNLPRAVAEASAEGGMDAANAILTTDTKPKTVVYEGDGWKIAGMAKGAGMLAPGLATMLVVITTDLVLTVDEADRALRYATSKTFNRLDSDGCMSTNDQVTLLASGASNVTVEFDAFQDALTAVCADLALQLLADSEGSSHDIAIRVFNATSEEDAENVGRTISRSNLFKAAVFGNDPNWGRILAAMGTTSAKFDPYNVDVVINGVRVCSKGGPDEDRSLVDMEPRQVDVDIDLKVGDKEATIWTSDLTYAYVEENSAYSS